jgi:hypothetical protein
MFDEKRSLLAVLWIRIRIHLAVLYPDPYWGCGSGSKRMEIDQNLQINLLPFKKASAPFIGLVF